MSKGTILTVAIGAVVVIGGWVYFSGSQLTVTDSSATKPWIEVVAPSVFTLKSSDGAKIKELNTGDEIAAGTTIEVSDNGLANLYFPDGSVLRIDSGTTVVMEAGSFDADSETLRVKINLASGRVWSKVISLTTPDSLWEVKTATAVATVRGTAFGMEYDGEVVSVIGSENTVAVSVIDPETNDVIEEASVIIEPDKVVEIKKEDVTTIKQLIAAREADRTTGVAASPEESQPGAGPRLTDGQASPAERPLLTAREASPEVLEKDWVRRAKEADTRLETKLKEIRGRVGDDEEIRQEIKKSLLPEVIKEPVIEKVITQPIDTVKPTPILELEKTESQTVAPVVKSRTLIIKTDRDFSQMVEEEVVVFSAILGGAENRNVTAEAQWQVVGNIGRFGSPGVFTARLGEAVAELGESFGSIVAVWKDPITGETFLAKTPIFKVKAKINLDFEQRG